MSKIVIEIERLSKQYRLGVIGTGTLSHDLNRLWAKLQGKEDPYRIVGDVNDHRSIEKSEYIWALKDVSFNVEQGEAIAIIGMNGAGKSTLLKILSRITLPTTGHIRAKGRVASLLEVGTGFHRELTGKENIFLNGAILGMSKNDIRSKFRDIVDFSGIGKYIDTPVKRYSSGMYVRLAFAVAAHLEPEILVVDEVLAVGDADFQKRCIGKMQDVATEGRTILFVSHNMIAVSALCPKAILLDKGMVVKRGPTNQVLSSYMERLSSDASIDIRERTDRKGTGRIRFTSVTFTNHKNRESNEGMSGETFHISLHYDSKHGRELQNVSVSLAIRGNFAQQLTALNSNDSQGVFPVLPSKGVLTCTVPKTPLVSGSYSLNLYCEVNGELADWVLHAAEFNIIAGDYFKTGQNLDSSQSLFLMDHTWKLQE